MDCHIDQRPDPRIEFTWHGFDEGDELTGRGHAAIADGELQGHIHIHLGDDSAFRAIRPSGHPLHRSPHASASGPEPALIQPP